MSSRSRPGTSGHDRAARAPAGWTRSPQRVVVAALAVLLALVTAGYGASAQTSQSQEDRGGGVPEEIPEWALEPARRPAAGEPARRVETGGGGAAPAFSDAQPDPTRVLMPAIGVDAALVGLGLEPDRSMEVPEFGVAGWYTQGPRPGAPGAAVIAGHFDSDTGPDVFYRLRDLEPGDVVIVERADGSRVRFAVERLAEHPKEALPAEEIWKPTAEPALTLITCGGRFDRSAGRYDANVVVFTRHLPG